MTTPAPKAVSTKCKVTKFFHKKQQNVRSVNIQNINELLPSSQKLYFLFLDSPIFPIWIFKLYLSKLNKKRDDPWQKPKQYVEGPEDEWYHNQVIGRDPLNNTMKNLSNAAKLSTTYTNHCIRASTVTELDTQGFEARHIMAVSGHKSENSIKNYSSVCPDNKKEQMSDALARKMNKNQSETAPNAIGNNSETCRPVPQEVQNLNTANFDIVPLLNEMDNDPLESEDFLQMIDKIEKENQHLIPSVTQPVPQPITTTTAVSMSKNPPVNNLASNMNYNSITQNVNRAPLLPHMFFPHSNVTINYNIKN